MDFLVAPLPQRPSPARCTDMQRLGLLLAEECTVHLFLCVCMCVVRTHTHTHTRLYTAPCVCVIAVCVCVCARARECLCVCVCVCVRVDYHVDLRLDLILPKSAAYVLDAMCLAQCSCSAQPARMASATTPCSRGCMATSVNVPSR